MTQQRGPFFWTSMMMWALPSSSLRRAFFRCSFSISSARDGAWTWARVSAESRPPESPELVLVANSPAARSTDLRDGEARRCRRGWRQPPPLRAGCALCIPRCSDDAGVGPRLRGPDARRPAGRRSGLALHYAAVRYARLRFVPRQPRPLRQHQQNSCSSLFFSSSPCSLITTTGSVSEILARRVSSADTGGGPPDFFGNSEIGCTVSVRQPGLSNRRGAAILALSTRERADLLAGN